MEETFHIDTVCHSGRPSDPRSAKETACYDLLDSLASPMNASTMTPP